MDTVLETFPWVPSTIILYGFDNQITSFIIADSISRNPAALSTFEFLVQIIHSVVYIYAWNGHKQRIDHRSYKPTDLWSCRYLSQIGHHGKGWAFLPVSPHKYLIAENKLKLHKTSANVFPHRNYSLDTAKVRSDTLSTTEVKVQ